MSLVGEVVGLAIDYDVAIALAVWAFLVASLVVKEQAEGVGLWCVVHLVGLGS